MADEPLSPRLVAAADQVQAALCAAAWRTSLAGERLTGRLPGLYRSLLATFAISGLAYRLRLCPDFSAAGADDGPAWWLPSWPTRIHCGSCAARAGARAEAERHGWPCAGCLQSQPQPFEQLDGAFLWLPGDALHDLLEPGDRAAASRCHVKIPAVFCKACRGVREDS